MHKVFLQRTLNAYDIYKIHPCSITNELFGFIYISILNIAILFNQNLKL